MKYGIYYAYWNDSWNANSFLDYVDKVSKLDFDILEINASPLAEYSDKQINELDKKAKDNNIILTAGYGPIAEHNIGIKNKRNKILDWYKKVFSSMQKLDIKIIGGAIYSYWPVDYSKTINKKEDWKKAVEGTSILASLASKYNINICCEVLNRFENYLLNTSKEAVSFVKEVNLSNVKVMLDIFHMNIEEESFSNAIKEAGKYLGHFHLGEANRRLPGEGRMPWNEILDALISINYKGYAVMEPFVKKGGQVGADIKIWRNLLEDISEDKLDLSAKNSVNFLKTLESARRKVKK